VLLDNVTSIYSFTQRIFINNMISGYQGGRLSFPKWSSEKFKFIRHMKVKQCQFAFYALKSTTDYMFITVSIHIEKKFKMYSPIPSVNLPLKTGAQVHRSVCRAVN